MGGVSCCSAKQGLCCGKDSPSSELPLTSEPAEGQEEVRSWDAKMGQIPGFGSLKGQDGTLLENTWSRFSMNGSGGAVGSFLSVSEGAEEPMPISRANSKASVPAYVSQKAASEASSPQVITFPDGSTYHGALENGKRHGFGTWTSDAWTYEGEWQADEIHGHGKQQWKDGRVFEGQFCQGRFSGYGRMRWPNGSTYDGEYKDDLKHGRGKFTWPDGVRSLDCEWVAGKRHGRGTYTTTKGVVRVGTWENDVWMGWQRPNVAESPSLLSTITTDQKLEHERSSLDS